MIGLPRGTYFGDTTKRLERGGVLITDTVYTHVHVPKHYHERPYFTYLLAGALRENSARETFDGGPGTLLFHNWEEAHSNERLTPHARGFHVEVDASWLTAFDVDLSNCAGTVRVSDPAVRLAFTRLFVEFHRADELTAAGVDMLLLEVMAGLRRERLADPSRRPAWVARVRAAILDAPHHAHDLRSLACIAGVHPSHLSQSFRKWSGCTISDLIRKARLARSVEMLGHHGPSLAGIACDHAFADQSHFTRAFRREVRTTPGRYRSMVGTAGP